MSGYIGNIPTPQATQTRDTFTATAGQTTFATSGYTPSFLDVFLNGVHLVNGTDYTASNGSDVVLTSGAAAGDVLEVVAFSTFSLSNISTDLVDDTTPQLGGDLDLNSSDITGTGNINITGGVTITTSVDFGNWTITESGGSLYFATGGTNMMKLNSSGTLDVAGDVNTNATIT